MSTNRAATSHTPALLVEGVSKKYTRLSLLRRRAKGPGTQALTDINFSVNQGETIGLLGPNGAGKTTTLKIVATLLYPSTGRVLLYGENAFEHQIKVRGEMGLVTCDERSFYWRLTGRQNLAFFATLYGLTKKQMRERSEPLLAALGLSEAADRVYHSYSSGMKQKLAIARGLLSEPRLVLYDEPTRSLDPLSAQNIRNWIREKRKQAPHQTHVIATNQLDEAEQLCDRVLIINKGTIIAQGTIQDIRRRWQQGEYEIHRVTYRGSSMNGMLSPEPDAGLFDVDVEKTDEAGITLKLRVSKGSAALSNVLETILRHQGVIVQCEVEQVPFDEVFCSLVLGNTSRPAAPQEVLQ